MTTAVKYEIPYLRREQYILLMYLLSLTKKAENYSVLTNCDFLLFLNSFENIEIEFQKYFGDPYSNDFSLQSKKKRFDFIILKIETSEVEIYDPEQDPYPYLEEGNLTYRFPKFLDLLSPNGKIITISGPSFTSIDRMTYDQYIHADLYPYTSTLLDYPYNNFWTEYYQFTSVFLEFENEDNYSTYIVEFQKEKMEGLLYFTEEFGSFPAIFLNREELFKSNSILHELVVNNSGKHKTQLDICFKNGPVYIYEESFWDFKNIDFSSKWFKNLYDWNDMELNSLEKFGFPKSKVKSFLEKEGPFKTLSPILNEDVDFLGKSDDETVFINEIISYRDFHDYLFLIENPNRFCNKFLGSQIFNEELEGRIYFLTSKKEDEIKELNDFKIDLYLQNILEESIGHLDRTTSYSELSITNIDKEFCLKMSDKFDFMYLNFDLIEGNNKQEYLSQFLTKNVSSKKSNSILLGRMYIKISNDESFENYILNFYPLFTDLIHFKNDSYIVGLSNVNSEKIKILDMKSEKISNPSLAYKMADVISKNLLEFNHKNQSQLISLINQKEEYFLTIGKTKNIMQDADSIVKGLRQLEKKVEVEGGKIIKKISEEHISTRLEIKNYIENLEKEINLEIKNKDISDSEKIELIYEHLDKLTIDKKLFNEASISANTWFVNWNKLDDNTKIFISEAELISKYINKDYSSVVVQYFRAIENQLAKKIFFDFKQKYKKEELISMFENQGENIKDIRLWDRLTRQLKEQLTIYDSPKFTFEMILFQLSFMPNFSFLAKNKKTNDLKMINRIYNQTKIFKELEGHIELNFKKLNDENLFNSFHSLKDLRNGGAHDRVILINEFENFKKEFNEIFFDFSSKII